MEFWFSQVFGAVALIFVSISYFLKDRYKFLLIQICVNFFYAVAFFIVGAYVGAAIMMTSSFRCLYIFICEKKSFKYTNQFLLIFIIIFVTLAIVFWKNWFDIFPLVACILFTIGFAIKCIQVGRPFFIIACILYATYNLLSMTYISAVASLLEAIVVFLSIVKFHKKNVSENEILS